MPTAACCQTVTAGPLVTQTYHFTARHKLNPTLLRFATFRKLLVRAMERYYPPPVAIAVFVSPQSVIH
ncbi:MAG TPA: hypothetical protein VHO69_11220 [Phototrophicaceae bacterium]|nr:hypothetical protein [Phototrophicaceae bacterium]